MSHNFSASLASLTGLDEPTAATQLLPHLDSLNTDQQVRTYLSSLLAPGPRSQSFIRQYTSFRFPAPAAPPPSNRWAASSPSTSAGPSHTSTPSSSNSNSRQAQQDKLQAAFGGPAAQGRIYQKASTGEPEGGGWGSGKSSAQGSRASSTSRASGPAPTSSLPESVPAISRSASPAPQDKGKGKGKQPQVAQEEGIELSEAALDELRGIEKALKGFLPPVKGKKVKRCFCSARLHPLSPYTPLCPSCSLILCALNPPSAPCPSCSFSPLLSPQISATHISTLESTKDRLVTLERTRVAHEKLQAEKERAAIRFPDLGADYKGVDRSGQVKMGYAAHAGGGAGAGLRERIEKAYQGPSGGKKGAGGKGKVEGPGRVLVLGKKGKVKVQTKTLVPVKGGKTRLTTQTTAEIDLAAADSDSEDHGGPPVFENEDDDGLRMRSEHELPPLRGAKAEREGWIGGGLGSDRTFERITLPLANRPVYATNSAVSAYLDADEGGEEDAVSRVDGRRKEQTVQEEEKENARGQKAIVPGAGVQGQGQGEEKKGRKGGRGKGKEKGVGEGGVAA